MLTRQDPTEWMIKMHNIGDTSCHACDGLKEWPKRCRCEGLVHMTSVLELDKQIYKYKSCDKCGDNYREAELVK